MKGARWQARLGHCNSSVLRHSISHIDDLKGGEFNDLDNECNTCAMGKSTREPQKQGESEMKSSKSIERVYTDGMGPLKPLSKGNAKYFVHYLTGLVVSQW